MIGASEFEVMKDDAILINICRGGVVDETAMINALLQGQIKGAGLDVFDYEPLPADSPLTMLDNVILTPHIGGGSGTTRTGEIQMAIDEFSCIIGGSSPRWPAKVNVQFVGVIFSQKNKKGDKEKQYESKQKVSFHA